MITERNNMKTEFTKSKNRLHITPGDSVRIAREILNLSQNQLSDLCGIPQSTLSAIESGKTSLGVERAKKLAQVLNVHPAVILFPNWEFKKSA